MKSPKTFKKVPSSPTLREKMLHMRSVPKRSRKMLGIHFSNALKAAAR